MEFDQLRLNQQLVIPSAELEEQWQQAKAEIKALNPPV